MMGRMRKGMEDGMEGGMEVSPKDMKEVKSLHDKLMSLADKYDMPMEALIEKCCGEMEEEEEGMEEEMPEDDKVDKMKVKFIIGKMRPQGEE